MSLILEKRVLFLKNVFFKAFSLEKGYFLVVQVSSKGVLFSSGNVSERGNFLIWRMIIRLPFYMRVAGPGGGVPLYVAVS